MNEVRRVFCKPQILAFQCLMPILVSMGSLSYRLDPGLYESLIIWTRSWSLWDPLSYGPETRLWEIKHLIQDCYQDKTSWQGSWVTYQQTTNIAFDMALKKKLGDFPVVSSKQL